MRSINKLILILATLTTIYSQSLNSADKFSLISGEKYLTGEDGIVRIYVNIWGHVAKPGTYLIYDGANIVDVLSVAGGPLIGANLKKLTILSESKSSINYDLQSLIRSKSQEELPVLKPYDTIIIDAKRSHLLFSRSSIVSAIIQLLNLGYTVKNLD